MYGSIPAATATLATTSSEPILLVDLRLHFLSKIDFDLLLRSRLKRAHHLDGVRADNVGIVRVERHTDEISQDLELPRPGCGFVVRQELRRRCHSLCGIDEG